MAKETVISQFNDIYESLKTDRFKPFYVLDGDETFFMDKITDYFENNILEESIKDYALFTFYGKETTWDMVANACQQISFVSSRVVVVLKEAQLMPNFEKLESYFLKPSPNAILLVNYRGKKIDGKTKVYKAIKANGVYLNCIKLYDNQVPIWIVDYCKISQHKISENNAALLQMYLGNDLTKIANEIDKIKINLKPKEEITSELIEKYIGISREYNVFELTKMLSNKDVGGLFRILNYFEGNPKVSSAINVIATLSNYYLKILTYHTNQSLSNVDLARLMGVNPFFLNEYHAASKHISAQKAHRALFLLYEMNRKKVGIGSVNIDDIDLIKELSYRLIKS